MHGALNEEIYRSLDNKYGHYALENEATPTFEKRYGLRQSTLSPPPLYLLPNPQILFVLPG